MSGARSERRPEIAKSLAAWLRAQELVFQGVQTYSKHPSMHVEGVVPIFAERAQGPWIWDVDGNRYLDLASGIGAVVLGHAEPRVNQAAFAAMERGIQLPLGTRAELDLAERLRDLVPAAGKSRLFKTGAEAVAAGVRIARAVTGRTNVIRGTYHGWHDWAMAGTTRRAGIPPDMERWMVPVAGDDLDGFIRAIERAPSELALVVVDPVPTGPDPARFLSALRESTRKAGALLLFDEIATGIRANGSVAHADYGVRPDLCTLGKAVANGFPLAVLTGTREVMDAAEDQVFISSTFAGDTVSIAAALAVIEIFQTTDALARLHAAGRNMREVIDGHGRSLGEGYSIRTLGTPWRFHVDVAGPDPATTHLVKSLFYQEMVCRGVLLGRVCYPMAAQDRDALAFFGDAVQSSLQIVQSAVQTGTVRARLVGKPIGGVPTL
jgi:glutamate-1-semialdehyde 2,1-aminomutase